MPNGAVAAGVGDGGSFGRAAIEPASKEPVREVEAAQRALWDPVSNACWGLWRDTARRNTVALREHFQVWPDSTQKRYEDVRAAVARRRPLVVGSAAAAAALTALAPRGYLVEHAIEFLEEENMLDPKPFGAALVPQILFA